MESQAETLYIDIFNGGIADSEKRGLEGAFFFGEHLDIHQDPNYFTILPKSVKDSGTVITGLVKWLVSGRPYDNYIYAYDENGVIYRGDSSSNWSIIHSLPGAHGQGLAVVADYLYYVQDNRIGRYGPLSGGAIFNDAWQTGLEDTSDTRLAPIKEFQLGFVIGHGNKMAYWDGSVWDVDKVVLPPGSEIRTIDIADEYAQLGTWRGSSITDSDEGYVAAWDGATNGSTFFDRTDEGGVNALLNYGNRLISICGSQGFIYLGTKPFQKLQQIPKVDVNKYIEVLPGAVGSWKGFAMMGFGGNTDSSDIKQGVYQWGSKSYKYPEVLNYAHTLSTGSTTGTGVKIGAILSRGNKFYFSWKDGSSYGIDVVTAGGAPYATAFYEMLIVDDNRVGDEKLANTIVATHRPLRSGESVQLSYKADRATNYTNGTANSTVDSKKTRLPIGNASRRFLEFQAKVTLGAGSTAPYVTSLGFEYDPNLAEETT